MFLVRRDELQVQTKFDPNPAYSQLVEWMNKMGRFGQFAHPHKLLTHATGSHSFIGDIITSTS